MGEIVKVRRKQSPYLPTTKQLIARERIVRSGRAIKAVCTGKTGDEFKRCRDEVLKCEYADPASCSTEVKSALEANHA